MLSYKHNKNIYKQLTTNPLNEKVKIRLNIGGDQNDKCSNYNS